MSSLAYESRRRPVRQVSKKSLPRLRLGITAFVIVVIATVAGYVLSAVQPTTWGGRAQIQFVPGGETDAESERQLATQRIMITSRPVLEPIAAAADTQVDELQQRVSVQSLGASEILEITVSDLRMEHARQTAGAIADAYVSVVASSNQGGGAAAEAARSIIDDRIASVERELDTVQANLNKVNKRLARAGEDPPPRLSSDQRRLEDQADELRGQHGDLQAQATDLQIDQVQSSRGSARLVSPAYVLEEPLGPRPLQAAAAGALAGLFLASGVTAYLVWRWRG